MLSILSSAQNLGHLQLIHQIKSKYSQGVSLFYVKIREKHGPTVVSNTCDNRKLLKIEINYW